MLRLTNIDYYRKEVLIQTAFDEGFDAAVLRAAHRAGCDLLALARQMAPS